MTIADLKEWVLTISASVSMIAVAVGIWMSLREYRIKLQAERRQQQSAEIEAEIRLQTLFSELMKTANGRSGYQVSEKAVEFCLQHIKTTTGDTDIATLNRAIENLAVLTLPVGSASQDAAIAAIAALTLRHKELEEPGLRALQSLCNPVTSKHAEHYLKEVTETLALRSNARSAKA
jgi:ribosomal protein S7